MALLVLLSVLLSSRAEATGKAHHVVVVVWDGMRPDFVTPELAPNAWRMANGGVTFANHHPVYLSSTEVNGTAIATGFYPAHSGVIANVEYRPEIDPTNAIRMEALAAVRKGDQVSEGHYLKRATTAEILQQAKRRTVIAGAKPIALLHDRALRPANAQDVNLFAGTTLPEEALAAITGGVGAFPPDGPHPSARNDWTARALTEQLWGAQDLPAYTLLWLSEPDYSQHMFGLGSPEALAAIKNEDENLGRVMKALEARGLLEKTDIFLVSDHGFSTIGQKVDIIGSLKQGGFNAVTSLAGAPEIGEVFVVSNGGSCLFYVIGHDHVTVTKLVEYLARQNYSGVIFTREPMDGTFSLAQAKLDSPDAPDIVLSMNWNSEKNTNGVPGMIASGVYTFGDQLVGMHVSLSKFDMHNTLIAAGPDFRKGVVDQLPTGNTDVAPTVLWILGVKPPQVMDGRVLAEALTIPGPKFYSYEPARLEASRKLETTTWRQYLNFSEVNGVVYFDEGNGGQTTP